MIKNLLFAAVILFSAAMHAQATAYPVPDITICAGMYVDLTQQNPIVLGNQSPDNYSVAYYQSEADAAANVNEIADPQFYFTFVGISMVYVRVTNLTTQEFAIGSFFIIVSEPPMPMPDISACEVYTLPPCDCAYYVNGVETPAGTDITASSVVEVMTTFGCFGDEFVVTIGNPVANVSQPLSSCDDNNDGFASFDLNSAVQQITGGIQGETVSFYATQIDAETGVNALISPYTNTTSGSQNIFVRVESGTGCYTVAPMLLQAVQCGTISGTVRIDTDGNGCSASDPAAQNQQIVRTFGNHYYYAYADAQGQYTFTNVLPGDNFIYVPMNALFGTILPTSQSINVATNGNYTADFCITPAATLNDAAVYVFPLMNARPGFPVQYKLIVQNKGNVPATGTVTLAYDDARLNFDLSSPAAATQSAGTLTFAYNSIPPLQTQSFVLGFTVETPPAAQLGEILYFTSDTSGGDDNPINDHASYTQLIVNSLDPNDKLVSTTAIAPDSQEYIRYIVNFQNTGTSAADTVKITDQLDPDLDWATFRPVSGSHAFSTEMTATGEVTFTFHNINLPAASANEPASHGYVVYEAKTTAGEHVGDIVENTANIYFDFNAPIVTNTVQSYFVQLGVQQHGLSGVVLYPNPTSGRVQLQLPDGFGNVAVTVTDLQGKIVLQQMSDSNAMALDASALSAGLYLVRIESGGESVVRKLVKE